MGAGGGAATWEEKNHFGKHWKSEKMPEKEKEFENIDKFSNVITTMVKNIEEPTSPHWRGKW